MTTSNTNNVNNESVETTVVEELSFYQRHQGKIKLALGACALIGVGIYAYGTLFGSDDSAEPSEGSSETETTETTTEADLQEIA